MKKLLILLGLSLVLASCSDNDSNPTGGDDDSMGTLHADGYYDLAAKYVKAMIDEDAELVIIDVSPYWADGHLPGALDLPLGSGAFDDAIDSLDKDMVHLVYCHGDGPSREAAAKLVEAGVTKVYRLIGNYGAWVAAGYDVEK